jgi:hypothetical protein
MKLDSWDDIVTSMLRNAPILHLEKRRLTTSASLIFRGFQGPEVWKRLPSLISRWEQKVGSSILDPNIDMSYTYGILILII